MRVISLALVAILLGATPTTGNAGLSSKIHQFYYRCPASLVDFVQQQTLLDGEIASREAEAAAETYRDELTQHFDNLRVQTTGLIRRKGPHSLKVQFTGFGEPENKQFILSRLEQLLNDPASERYSLRIPAADTHSLLAPMERALGNRENNIWKSLIAFFVVTAIPSLDILVVTPEVESALDGAGKIGTSLFGLLGQLPATAFTGWLSLKIHLMGNFP